MRLSTMLGLAAAVFMAVATPASADLLADIKAAGKVRIAVVTGVPLFAYVDENLKPTGSDVETARLIAEALGVDLELVEIANAARVPTIQARKADILVGNLAITPERQKVVDFTIPYATLDIVVAAPPRIEISDYDDLAGKRIGVTRATVNDQLVSEQAPGAEPVRFEDDATLITALASKQVDVVSTQNAVLAAINDKRADDPLDVKFVQRSLDLGIAIPQGEQALRDWLNGWIKENFDNGTLKVLFRKFHDRDLPEDLTERVH